MALAFEPEEKELMEKPPRPKDAPILDGQLKFLVFVIGVFLSVFLLGLSYWLNQGFLHLHYIQTVIFVALGIDSLFVCFACRSLRKPIFSYRFFTNKPLLATVGLGLVLLVVAVYFPPIQSLLRTQPLGLQEWLFLLSFGVFNLLSVETAKWFFRYNHRR